MSLNTQPTADVTIPISSSDMNEGTVSTVSLTFTTADWNVPQTVTITGVDDTVFDGDIAYTIVLGPATSADSLYNGLDPVDVSVTNTDNDVLPTKFYVINDGSPDRTYEYGATGTAVENYSLNSGNTAPRGAASNAAGDKVWVADANKKVYVYNTSGGLLGSWTAGTLASNATPEGIATDGTDVWIVDSKSDKVFKYTGAAARLSGSQNAASSFSLNSGNSNPKGIVTDGTSLWVVNDAGTDKVFKYTLAGALLGSWTIDAANAAPTGLTIDPANVSNIWIVDSGTDKIYQYNAASNRTSGSQAAAATFALATGNTNPQDIADPPLSRSELVQMPVAAVSRDDSPAARIAGQLFFASLGKLEGDRPSDSQCDVTARRGVDEIISPLGMELEPVRSPASITPNAAITSRRTATQRHDVDLELVDGDLDDSIDLIAHDLLEMGRNRRDK